MSERRPIQPRMPATGFRLPATGQSAHGTPSWQPLFRHVGLPLLSDPLSRRCATDGATHRGSRVNQPALGR